MDLWEIIQLRRQVYKQCFFLLINGHKPELRVIVKKIIYFNLENWLESIGTSDNLYHKKNLNIWQEMELKELNM